MILRVSGAGGLRWRGQTLRASLGKPVWMTSLVAWLGKMGLSIHTNGPAAPDPSSELVTGDRERLIGLANRGIALVGEESTTTVPLPFF